jgi:hypothetical protein
MDTVGDYLMSICQLIRGNYSDAIVQGLLSGRIVVNVDSLSPDSVTDLLLHTVAVSPVVISSGGVEPGGEDSVAVLSELANSMVELLIVARSLDADGWTVTYAELCPQKIFIMMRAVDLFDAVSGYWTQVRSVHITSVKNGGDHLVDAGDMEDVSVSALVLRSSHGISISSSDVAVQAVATADPTVQILLPCKVPCRAVENRGVRKQSDLHDGIVSVEPPASSVVDESPARAPTASSKKRVTAQHPRYGMEVLEHVGANQFVKNGGVDPVAPNVPYVDNVAVEVIPYGNKVHVGYLNASGCIDEQQTVALNESGERLAGACYSSWISSSTCILGIVSWAVVMIMSQRRYNRIRNMRLNHGDLLVENWGDILSVSLGILVVSDSAIFLSTLIVVVSFIACISASMDHAYHPLLRGAFGTAVFRLVENW